MWCMLYVTTFVCLVVVMVAGKFLICSIVSMQIACYKLSHVTCAVIRLSSRCSRVISEAGVPPGDILSLVLSSSVITSVATGSRGSFAM